MPFLSSSITGSQLTVKAVVLAGSDDRLTGALTGTVKEKERKKTK